MTVIRTMVDKPTYIAMSTDVVSGSIVGTPLLGATVYLMDSQEWYIVSESSGSSYYLLSYVDPALET